MNAPAAGRAPVQPCLPIVAASTGCGYCNRPLTLQPAGDWACEHCKPLLAAVRTEGDWILMHRRARLCVKRCRCGATDSGATR